MHRSIYAQCFTIAVVGCIGACMGGDGTSAKSGPDACAPAPDDAESPADSGLKSADGAAERDGGADAGSADTSSAVEGGLRGAACADAGSNAPTPITGDPSYVLVFDDEFNGIAVDSSVWTISNAQTFGGPALSASGNNVVQNGFLKQMVTPGSCSLASVDLGRDLCPERRLHRGLL